MDWEGLIANAPNILLLIIPGYVAAIIKERFGLEQKHKEFDIVLFSLLYSFIIGIMYGALQYLLVSSLGLQKNVFENILFKQICFILLGVLFGWFLVKIPKSRLGGYVIGVFNNNISPEPSVWIKAMKNSKGAWATVHLNNGLIYTGKLIHYTSDYNDEIKEILLTDFRLSIKNEKVDSPEDFCTTIVDNTNGIPCKVYLKRDDAVSIEIFTKDESAGG